MPYLAGRRSPPSHDGHAPWPPGRCSRLGPGFYGRARRGAAGLGERLPRGAGSAGGLPGLYRHGTRLPRNKGKRRARAERRPSTSVPGRGEAGRGGAAGPRGPGQARPSRGGRRRQRHLSTAGTGGGAARRGGAAPLKGPAGPRCHPRRAEPEGRGRSPRHRPCRDGAGRTVGAVPARPSGRQAGGGRARRMGKRCSRGVSGDSPRARLRGRRKAAGGGHGLLRAWR